MKKFIKNSGVATLIVSFVVVALGLVGPTPAHAATAPVLGVATGYSVFGNAGITESAAQLSHLWGNAGGNGFGHANLIASQVDGAIDAGANPTVVSAISFAYGDLADEAQTGAINLATSPTVTPGVYDVAATAFNSTLTLNGAGVYIFRSTSSIAQTAGGTMSLTNGATACNVFWQIPTSMTFAAVGSIYGTIITNTGLISFVSGVSLQGRAWAKTQVTMINNQITEPTCAAATPPPSGSPGSGLLNVVKVVINDNGGTKTINDFSLFANNTPVSSGVTGSFNAPQAYTITETGDSGYTHAFSGDCNSNGFLNLNPGDYKLCVITNNDVGVPVPVVPPLIEVLKVPSPLALPNGPGPVTYTYTLHNIGTVPVTDITMVGDTCSPIVYVSGDVNGDSELAVGGTWVFRCTTTLSETHTNIVTATGWANGISAIDTASAIVVVGAPIVPPLIHITKIPSPLALPTAGGIVNYAYTVTNPGTESLDNVFVIDDKCTGLPGRVVGHPGDLNHNNLLESNEAWSFTCRSTLTQTTTNTAIASGEANGLTAKDFAVATVIVGAVVGGPSLPPAGFAPSESILARVILAVSIFAVLAFFAFARRKELA